MSAIRVRTAAQEARRILRRRERIIEGIIDPARIPHGTPTGYTGWACRCGRCGAAQSDYRRDRRARDRRAAGLDDWYG